MNDRLVPWDGGHLQRSTRSTTLLLYLGRDTLGRLILVVEEQNGPFLYRIVLRHQGIPLVLANLEGNASTVG
jgi:hypothetical protein